MGINSAFKGLNCHLPGSIKSEPQWTNCNFMCCDWDLQLLLQKVDALLYKCIVTGVKNIWFKLGYKSAPVILTSCKKKISFFAAM
jgi:hypothetical protein